MISGEGTKGFLIWFTGGEELIRLIRSEIIFYIRFRNLLKVSSIFPKAVVRRCYVKKVFWEFRKIHRKTGLQPSTLLEWGSGKIPFLQNISEGLILYTGWMIKYVKWSSILRSSISPENTKKRCDGAFLRTKLTPQSVFLGGIFIFAKEIEIGIIFCSATVLLSVFSLNLCWLIGNPFTHSCIVLRNCQTCFKNFAVFTL